MNSNDIDKSIHIFAEPPAVFDALTNPSSITSYFPLTEVLSDWNVGSAIKFIGEQSGIDEGVIDTLDKNLCFQYSYWNKNHGTQKESTNFITIKYSLESCDDNRSTTLTVLQTNLPSEEYKKNMDPIWDFLLKQLKEYIEKN